MVASREKYHDLIPTPEEASKNKTSFYSDHLFAMSEIPVGETKLRVATWNVLKPNLFSGYYPTEENKDEENARQTRSIEALIKLISGKNTPDVILLQEYYFDKKGHEQLQSELSKLGWEISGSKDSTTITLFNAKKLAEIKEAEVKEQKKDLHSSIKTAYEPTSMHRSLFKIKSAETSTEQKEQQVMISNVHFPHGEDARDIDQLESYLTSLMKEDQAKYGFAIVGGDFNHRYAPIGKPWLPNNTVHASFRKPEMQGADWTDGFFYMGEDRECHQPLKTDTVDLSTSETFQTREVKVSEFSSQKQKELLRFRPTLSCAVEYKIESKLTPDELSRLKEIGAYLGRKTNAQNKHKTEFSYSLRSAADHLRALDKCLPLLLDKNPEVAQHAWIVFTNHLDCAKALTTLAYTRLEYKSAIQKILEEWDNILQKHKHSDKAIDAFIKDKFIKFSVLNYALHETQEKQISYAAQLIEHAPQLAIECLRKIDRTKLEENSKPDYQFTRTITLAYSITAKNKLDVDLSHLTGGFLDTMKRKQITNEMRALNTLIEQIRKIDNKPDLLSAISKMPTDLRKNIERDLSSGPSHRFTG